MRPLSIFNFLLVYVVLQLAWWGYLLVELSSRKIDMVVGEFSVFILVLIIGMNRIRKAINDEDNLNQQQKNFLLSVTHELKSPLASIKLYLQTILKRDLEKKQRDTFIKNSLGDIERLDNLVENMLMATKFENKSYSFPKEQFNFSELVGQVLNRIKENSHERFNFNGQIEPDISILGDRFALGSAINNIIENALNYSAEGSIISVNLSKSNEQLFLQVADQGIGIDDKEKKRIFNKFYRGGNEEIRRTRGTGLGLFIVKQVLDNHQALIQVKNNLPAGSIFEIIFDL